ncbi:glycosyltransferase involved in cell wall biosynthesis [Photorhabdus asymbiotica]|nr:glycosyltransferase involved in cell wall biosynthesis [Photorhabdus asymbiotica]
MSNMTIIHLIISLHQGGAESQLEKLILHSHAKNIEHIVISLIDNQTPLMIKLKSHGVSVYTTNFSRKGGLTGIFQLRKLLKTLVNKDTIIQCWMYHANLLGFLIAKSLGITSQIIWSIRRTAIPSGITGFISKVCAAISKRYPIPIICCAESAKESHIKAGYSGKYMYVFHNGIDTNLFSPDKEKRNNTRNNLKLSNENFIIGMVARYSPIKGHIYLLQALQYLIENIPEDKIKNLRLVMIGRNVEKAALLQPYLNNLSLRKYLVMKPEIRNIWDIMPAFDILCMPSESEGFPNVVAESMSCGVVPLVTDVGEAKVIVGDTGYIVPPFQPEYIAKAIIKLINMNENELKKLANLAHLRIKNNFSIEKAWADYKNFYQNQIINNGN